MTNGTTQQEPALTMVPAVNIIETPDAFIVTLDVPGAEKEHITARIEGQTLTVQADITSDADANGTKRQYRREFSLAQDIDVNTVDARYELGVLTVTLKKNGSAIPHTIQVNVK